MKLIKHPRALMPRGTILVLTALLLFALMGLAALAVDVGVIASARAQLKTVADAAALAGARQLASDRRISSTLSDLTPEISAATFQAKAIGQANSVLNHNAVITDSDVVIGYLRDPTNPSDTPQVGSLLSNSVQVTATRSSDHVSVVPAFFSRALGYSGTPISVTSTATVNFYPIKGYQNSDNFNSTVLPIALKSTYYYQMISATPSPSNDQYKFDATQYNPPTSNGVSQVSDGIPADGIPESVTYPVSVNNAGDWGTLYFDPNSKGVSTLVDNINNGIPPSELSSLPATYAAKAGMNAGMKTALTSIIGKAVEIPIYDSTNGGNGANLTYHIINYAWVRIMAVSFQGSANTSKYVIIQPAIGDDPTAIPDYTQPPNSWTQGGQIVLHLSR